MTLVITLEIKNLAIKPYVRMTQRGKWIKTQAKEYLVSKKNLQWKIKQQMQKMNLDPMPARTPLSVGITVYTHTSQGHRADLDNILKSVLDSCNGVVIPDDRWVDEIYITRKIGDEQHLILNIGLLSRRLSADI